MPTPQQAALNTQMTKMNEARDTNILTKIGATTYTFTREAIVSMPQGDNTPIDKLILQFPGVSYNSAASNPNFHVRSEYANVQTRINGVVIPEGVSGLGALIDTNFIAKISLLTGTCPHSMGFERPACSILSAGVMRPLTAKSAFMAAAIKRSRQASTTVAASVTRNTSLRVGPTGMPSE